MHENTYEKILTEKDSRKWQAQEELEKGYQFSSNFIQELMFVQECHVRVCNNHPTSATPNFWNFCRFENTHSVVWTSPLQ